MIDDDDGFDHDDDERLPREWPPPLMSTSSPPRGKLNVTGGTHDKFKVCAVEIDDGAVAEAAVEINKEKQKRFIQMIVIK